MFCGVAVVQLEQIDNKSSTETSTAVSTRKESPLLGLTAVVASCLMSGVAGVYFEKILKNTKQTVWLRNAQLGIIGVITGLIAVALCDGDTVREKGFLYGYDWLVWLVVCLQLLGGFAVAVVLKYADNILKGFATSASFIVSMTVSMAFGFSPSLQFYVGAGDVMVAVFMYSMCA